MNESTKNLETGDVPVLKPAARISKISLWLGFIAVFPYMCGMLAYLYYDLFIGGSPEPIPTYYVMLPLRIIAFAALFGNVCGFPFGLAAIITASIGVSRRSKTKKSMTFALIGILLGIAGIIGHLWFFATCQFCQ